ncbi:MAG: hypothetical protein ACOY94_05985 [Bacillota bacterium]
MDKRRKRLPKPEPEKIGRLTVLLAVQRWRPEDGTKADRVIAAARELAAMPEDDRQAVLQKAGIHHPVALPEFIAATDELEAYFRSQERPALPEAPKRLWWGVLCSDGTVEVFPYDEKAGLKQVDGSRDRPDVVEWYGPFQAGLSQADAMLWIALTIFEASVEKAQQARTCNPSCGAG